MNSTRHDPATPDAPVADYDEMIDILNVGISEAVRKVDEGRVRSPENERVRIKWIRCLAYAVNIRRQVTNDRDLEELAERLDALESAEVSL